MGYKELKPVVYSGFYPIDSKEYPILKDALSKISLSDSSIKYLPETSKALGFGFRVGFLGMLHMEVLQERLEREFGVDLIATAPSVEFKVVLTNDKVITIANPSDLPESSLIKHIEEPMIRASIVIPDDYIGKVMELCQNKRGIYKELEYLDDLRRKIVYDLPMVEIVFDFFDKLKSITKGYATFDYDMIGYFTSSLVKMDILIAGEKVDALSIITHKDFVQSRGKSLVKKLKEVVPRQNFEVAIQAAIGGKIISRETVKAYRKDVTAKLYGGDVTRRQKLLKKQKKGKKRMKQIGKVSLPQEAFLAILSNESN
jgi:GTP-binding protein LepA